MGSVLTSRGLADGDGIGEEAAGAGLDAGVGVAEDIGAACWTQPLRQTKHRKNTAERSIGLRTKSRAMNVFGERVFYAS